MSVFQRCMEKICTGNTCFAVGVWPLDCGHVSCIPAGSLFVALMFVRLTLMAAEKLASVKGVKLEKN